MKIDSFGIDDNFFDLGGTSLDIIKINDKITRELNEEDNVKHMFRYTTIRSFAAFINSKKQIHVPEETVDKRTVKIRDVKNSREKTKK